MQTAAPERATVMIVDDTPANLAFLSDALDDAGYRVLVAVDGGSALRQLRHVRPDVILLDAVMPGLDGFETCQRLKSQDETREIPVIFMTALNDTSDVVRGFSEGAVDYVTKPVHEQEILARVAAHIDRSRRLSRARSAVDALLKAGLTVDAEGRITWQTSHVGPWLAKYCDEAPGERLPRVIDAWLEGVRAAVAAGLPPAQPSLAITRDGDRLNVSYVGQINPEESLLLMEVQEGTPAAALARAWGLTPREAEVLAWIARGKTNRDIGEILGMSPRTVNKHLEHIFVKMGVETRTAAATRALSRLNGAVPAPAPTLR